jgi:hypothetical protein
MSVVERLRFSAVAAEVEETDSDDNVGEEKFHYHIPG